MAKLGRPTKYKEEYIEMIDEYLETCKDSYEVVCVKNEEGEIIKERVVKNVNIPSKEGFAIFLGVSTVAFRDWEKIHENFSSAIKEITARQKQALLNGGLSGEYNPLIARLGLSANHNMREKSDMTSDGKAIEGNKITFKNYKDESKGK